MSRYVDDSALCERNKNSSSKSISIRNVQEIKLNGIMYINSLGIPKKSTFYHNKGSIIATSEVESKTAENGHLMFESYPHHVKCQS